MYIIVYIIMYIYISTYTATYFIAILSMIKPRKYPAINGSRSQVMGFCTSRITNGGSRYQLDPSTARSTLTPSDRTPKVFVAVDLHNAAANAA